MLSLGHILRVAPLANSNGRRQRRKPEHLGTGNESGCIIVLKAWAVGEYAFACPSKCLLVSAMWGPRPFGQEFLMGCHKKALFPSTHPIYIYAHTHPFVCLLSLNLSLLLLALSVSQQCLLPLDQGPDVAQGWDTHHPPILRITYEKIPALSL